MQMILFLLQEEGIFFIQKELLSASKGNVKVTVIKHSWKWQAAVLLPAFQD